jgi:hypothetical protein
VFVATLRSLEWAFAKKPLRRYELQKGQDTPVERRLSISNVLLDAFDLIINQRGIGWSWSSNSFPHKNTPPASIASIWIKLLWKFTAFDTSHYIMQRALPSINDPVGGSLFNRNLTPLPRIALAALASICGGVWTYALVETMYHIATLTGRIIFRQPASQWPRHSYRPWMATSIQEFWGSRWHQNFRHTFIVFGARPGGAILGKPGAVMGAFAVSALLHHIGLWALGNGTEFSTAGGFFLLMGIGAIMEDRFERVTGLRVQGWFGWLWTMLWTLVWGTFMLDGWARHGVFANDFFPNGLRPGKILIDSIIALWSE